jgi:hypothetical protein
VRAAVVSVTVLVLLAVGFGTATFGGATAPRPTIPTTTPTSGDPALSDIP